MYKLLALKESPLVEGHDRCYFIKDSKNTICDFVRVGKGRKRLENCARICFSA